MPLHRNPRQGPHFPPSPLFPSFSLVALQLPIAGWLRYLMGVDEQGIVFGKPDSVGNKLEGILGNAQLFGVDLYKTGRICQKRLCFQAKRNPP